MYLSFIDDEINAIENLLLRFGNNGGEILDFKEKLLAVFMIGNLRMRVYGGGCGGDGETPAARAGAEERDRRKFGRR